MSAAARLPQGVELGGLGSRVGAYLLDMVPVIVLYVAVGLAWGLHAPTTVLIVLGAAAALLLLAWGVFVWFRLATTGSSPGMVITKLELVGYRDGRPLGWGRVLLRWLIFGALGATGIGWILLVVFLILNPLRQGWHDLAVGSIVIRYRQRGGRPSTAAPPARQPATATVGLPAHLRTADPSFAPPTPPAGPSFAPSAEPGPYSAPGPYLPPGQSAGHSGQSAGHLGQPVGHLGQPVGHQGPGGPPQPASAPAGPPVSRSAGSPPAGGDPFRSASAQSPIEGGPISSVPGFGEADPLGGDGRPADSTRLVPKRGGVGRAPDQGWIVALDDGRQVPVAGLLLIGRDPAPRPGESITELITVSDNSRMVSKTHVAIGVDNKGAYVMDRGSTNGTALAASTGGYEPCPAGEIVRVREGQIVSFGDHRLEIRRSY